MCIRSYFSTLKRTGQNIDLGLQFAVEAFRFNIFLYIQIYMYSAIHTVVESEQIFASKLEQMFNIYSIFYRCQIVPAINMCF